MSAGIRRAFGKSAHRPGAADGVVPAQAGAKCGEPLEGLLAYIGRRATSSPARARMTARRDQLLRPHGMSKAHGWPAQCP